MNEKLIPFFKAVSMINSGVFNREVLIRHAVALAISDFAVLPTGPVENTEIAFNTLVRSDIEGVLADFNEITPLNMTNTCNLVRAYWRVRYNIAQGTARSFSTGDFIGNVSGIAVAVSPEELETINTNASDFDYLYQAARAVMETITGTAKINEGSFPKGDEQAVPSELVTPGFEHYRDICDSLRKTYGSTQKSSFGNYATESTTEDEKKSFIKKMGEKIAAFFARIKEYIVRFWNWLTGKKKATEEQSKEASDFVKNHPDVLDPDEKFVKPEFKKRGNGDVSDASVKSFKNAEFIREEYRTSGEKVFEDLEKKIGVFFDAREEFYAVIRKQAVSDGFRASLIFGGINNSISTKFEEALALIFTKVEETAKILGSNNKDDIIKVLKEFSALYDESLSELHATNFSTAYNATSKLLLDNFSSKKIPDDLSKRLFRDESQAIKEAEDAMNEIRKGLDKFDVSRILGLYDSSELSQEQVREVALLIAVSQQKAADTISVMTRMFTKAMLPSIALVKPILTTKEKYEEVVSYIESIEKDANLSDKTKKLISDFKSENS